MTTPTSPADAGVRALPKPWSVAVQLISTFGLAVFLVLYYVLVTQPREAQRYEQLRQAVTNLSEVVAGQQSLLTREQSAQLEDLYVLALAGELADFLPAELASNPSADALARRIEDKLIFQTRLLEGLRRKDGGTLSEMLTHKIRNSDISREIAQRAVAEWKTADRGVVSAGCRGALTFAIKRAAMAK